MSAINAGTGIPGVDLLEKRTGDGDIDAATLREIMKHVQPSDNHIKDFMDKLQKYNFCSSLEKRI